MQMQKNIDRNNKRSSISFSRSHKATPGRFWAQLTFYRQNYNRSQNAPDYLYFNNLVYCYLLMNYLKTKT